MLLCLEFPCCPGTSTVSYTCNIWVMSPSQSHEATKGSPSFFLGTLCVHIYIYVLVARVSVCSGGPCLLRCNVGVKRRTLGSLCPMGLERAGLTALKSPRCAATAMIDVQMRDMLRKSCWLLITFKRMLNHPGTQHTNTHTLTLVIR